MLFRLGMVEVKLNKGCIIKLSLFRWKLEKKLLWKKIRFKIVLAKKSSLVGSYLISATLKDCLPKSFFFIVLTSQQCFSSGFPWILWKCFQIFKYIKKMQNKNISHQFFTSGCAARLCQSSVSWAQKCWETLFWKAAIKKLKKLRFKWSLYLRSVICYKQ